MENLLKPIKTTSKIRNNVEKFESLALQENSSHIQNVISSRKPKAIIEVDEDYETAVEDTLRPRKTSILGHSESETTARLIDSAQLQITSRPHGGKRDSTAFLRRTYLQEVDAQSSLLDTEVISQAALTSSSSSSNPPSLRPQSTSLPKTVTTIPGKSLADDAKEILRSQPSRQDLDAVLDYLYFGIQGRHDFNIKIPSPQSAQLIHILVTVTVPDLWPVLNQSMLKPQRARSILSKSVTESLEVSASEHRTRKIILECLACTAGIGAILGEIQQHCSRVESQSAFITKEIVANHNSSARTRITNLLSVLSSILHGSKSVYSLLTDTMHLYPDNDMRRKLSWNEIVGFIAGGRILGLAAEALTLISKQSVDHSTTMSDVQNSVDTSDATWLGDGAQFASWLGKGASLACVKIQPNEKECWKYLALLMKRALSLGNREILVSELYSSLLLGKKALWTPLCQLLSSMSDYEQKQIFDTILLDISKKYLGGVSSLAGFYNENQSMNNAISATAALITGLIKENRILEEHLEDWLVVVNSSHAAVGLATRRALVATLATVEGRLERVLGRALANFADKLQIQHASSLKQDAYTQTILLAIGHFKRTDASVLKRTSISSLFMRSVSNRLAATIPHSRLLGMIVGIANSRAMDTPDKVLDFGVEDLETDEVQLWLEIPKLHDLIADETQITELVPFSHPVRPLVTQYQKKSRNANKQQEPLPKSNIISIEEITGFEGDENKGGEDEDDDADLVPYGKPDSDPEDSDDDPTMINRSKPSAPVYIVDLIRQLETTDKPDVIELALRTAPGLIKRKTGFGTELSDNIDTLTTSLVNLQEDGFSSHTLFESLQLESIVACILAQPASIANSLVTLYFEGDFSISQRVLLLTALGLAARELAGYQIDIDSMNRTKDEGEETSFPSKRLPHHLQPSQLEQWSDKRLKPLEQNPISALTLSQAQSTIRPMALAAADKITGPSVLKIRTFSSRMAVEKKNKEKHEARTKRIPKYLHSLLAKFFFLPLCGRLNLLVSASIATGARNSKINTTTLLPSLVRMVLQTLTLVLYTLGPSAVLHLSTLTHETLLLLLAVHASTHLAIDAVVLPALLHLLLALMDVTIEAGYAAQERLIVDHGEQIAELIQWANDLGERIPIPELDREDDGGMPWTVLVAGIQVKWLEMGQRFQGRMLGLINTDI